MSLYLHTKTSKNDLKNKYHDAFEKGIELFMVTAYLTEWDKSLKLNDKCKAFRLIVGKDFGITRKKACEEVLEWLPLNRKSQFMVADGISGFHPKAIFWKDKNNIFHSIIGSSNFTKAAFNSNYEANIYSKISSEEFENIKTWIKEVEGYSVVISEDWLLEYKEGLPVKNNRNIKPTILMELPKPKGYKKLIKDRRKQLASYNKKKIKIVNLFRKSKDRKITSLDFYKELNNLWNWEIGNRFQGKGWEILGKNSDFHELSISFINILDTSDFERDDVVAEEIDRLTKLKIPTRRSLLSEMLCLKFPDFYPVLNKPVEKYLRIEKFKSPKNSSDGSKYIDLSRKLRFLLQQNPKHPAKNLAELDALIWLEYGE